MSYVKKYLKMHIRGCNIDTRIAVFPGGVVAQGYVDIEEIPVFTTTETTRVCLRKTVTIESATVGQIRDKIVQVGTGADLDKLLALPGGARVCQVIAMLIAEDNREIADKIRNSSYAKQVSVYLKDMGHAGLVEVPEDEAAVIRRAVIPSNLVTINHVACDVPVTGAIFRPVGKREWLQSYLCSACGSSLNEAVRGEICRECGDRLEELFVCEYVNDTLYEAIV